MKVSLIPTISIMCTEYQHNISDRNSLKIKFRLFLITDWVEADWKQNIIYMQLIQRSL